MSNEADLSLYTLFYRYRIWVLVPVEANNSFVGGCKELVRQKALRPVDSQNSKPGKVAACILDNLLGVSRHNPIYRLNSALFSIYI